eukprot:12418057-Prorocentrum_lima.AAC.1
MTSSLVGSEMCIRDRRRAPQWWGAAHRWPQSGSRLLSAQGNWQLCESVSYTHLTLPTICSV